MKYKSLVLFLIITTATFLLIEQIDIPQNLISFGVLGLISGAIIGSILLVIYKHFIQTTKLYNKNQTENITTSINSLKKNINKLSVSVHETKESISKQNDFGQFVSNNTLDFSIIPSTNSHVAYILDQELSIKTHNNRQKAMFDKLVTILKKNGHSINILKPYNPTHKVMINKSKPECNMQNNVSMEFPANLINYN